MNCRSFAALKCTRWPSDSPCSVSTYVPGLDLVIKQGKIRGQISQGMLCSLSELNLGDEHDGIAELPSEAPVGTGFADFAQEKYAGLVDPVIEIAITPNRGIALVCAVLPVIWRQLDFGTLKDIDFSAAEGEFVSPLTWQIDEDVSSLVPLISGRLFEGVSNGSAPSVDGTAPWQLLVKGLFQRL